MRGRIRFNGTTYNVAQVIDSGLTSLVYKTKEGPVIKKYKHRAPMRQLEREVYWLNRLTGTQIVPELLATDRAGRAILLSDCGDPISVLNAPPDWEKQIAALLQLLSVNGCAHNDLSENAVLVRDGRLRVVDFAFAVEKKEDLISSTIEFGKKTRYFLDEQIANYLRFKFYSTPRESEPHSFVLWKADAHETIKNELSKQFDIVRSILYTPKIFAKLGGSAEDILKRFYSRSDAIHGDKGRAPFILYFVLDRKPRYEVRNNVSRGTREMVNVNVFDMKAKLRNGRNAFLHGSSSLQECYDNLQALSLYAQDEPKSYWLRWRPSFSSIADFFDRINNTKELKYVVLRNFNDLVDGRIVQGSDIDLLVNDFYLFKRSVGAIGYKHKVHSERWKNLTGQTRKYCWSGLAHEYGGYKVAGLVNISGQEISVDIRYVGDGYYCERWERDMLARSVKLRNICVPDPENQFYSLLYHALVHKPLLSDRYRRKLGQMAPVIGVHSQILESDEQSWSHLDEFVRRSQYTYDRPRELSIPLSAGARKRMGITPQKELETARALATDGELLQAMDLAQGILWSEPEHLEAKKLLIAIKKARGSSARATLVRLVRATQLGRALPNAVKHSIRQLLFRGVYAKG